MSAELSYLAWCAAVVPIAIWIALVNPHDWSMAPAVMWSGLAAGALNDFGVIAAFAAYRALTTASLDSIQLQVIAILARAFLEPSKHGVRSADTRCGK